MCTNLSKRKISSVKVILSQLLFATLITASTGTMAADKMIGTKENSQSIIKVTLNQATLVQLEDRISDAIIGNPSIADITMQSGKTFVLTGKSYGRTNIMLMNKKGEIIFNRSIHVDDDLTNIVRIQRGAIRVSYTCTPNCQPTPTIGDHEEYMKANAKNIKTMRKNVDGAIAASADSE